MNDSADISIITPSFNSLGYLRRCCASVRDQRGVTWEHLVIDGGSTDGTAAWLAAEGIEHVSERDRGMYDALNKGLRRARGKIIAYLNADEQYLPGALEIVARYFDQHPDVDLAFGGVLVVRPDGSLLAYRKAYPVRLAYIATSHLYTLTCAMFFRRRLVDNGLLFDPALRDVGDADFVIRALRAGFRPAHLAPYLAAFTMTGNNMSSGPNARAEKRRLHARAPWSLRLIKYPLVALRRAEKVLHGAYRQDFPLRYALYAPEGAQRQEFVAASASARWPGDTMAG